MDNGTAANSMEDINRARQDYANEGDEHNTIEA